MTNTTRANYRPCLGDVARASMLLVCHCNLCRRTRVYAASELVEIYGPALFLEDLFGGQCPKCQSGGDWRVRERYAWDSDVGMLTVRRPAGVRRIQLWRDRSHLPVLRLGNSSISAT